MISVLLSQMAIMFIYIVIGMIAYKTKIITNEGSRTIGALLVNFIMPFLIINSFCLEYSSEKLAELGQSFLFATIATAVSLLMSFVLFKKDSISNMASSFSNAGFFGVPVVTAVLGPEYTLCATPLLCYVGVLQYTYGSILFSNKKIKFKKIISNPYIVATAIGLVLFITKTGNRLPAIPKTCISSIAALNVPLAMMNLGVYLAQSDFKKLFTTLKLYKVCLARLLLIPLIEIPVFMIIPKNTSVKLAVIIGAMAPCGANTAVYAQLYNKDYVFACQTVALSTLVSLATIPAVTVLANTLFTI